MSTTILLATDGSPSAELATQRALDLALATGWALRTVVVWHTPVVAAMGYNGVTALPELNDAERDQAQHIAASVVERAKKLGVEASSDVRQGDPADEICAAAAAIDAAVIVVGTHGWGSLKRLFLGSVSTRVVHEAPCAVLVVRDAAAVAAAA